MAKEYILGEITLKVRKLTVLGFFEFAIGLLALIAGIIAPDTALLGGYGILQLIGFIIGVVAIVVGALAVAGSIGIPIGVFAKILTPPLHLEIVTYLSAAKGILCLLCLMWVLGAFTWTSFIFYVFATVVDFALTFYSRKLVDWIMARIPPKLRFTI